MTVPARSDSSETSPAPITRRSVVLIFLALMLAMLLASLNQTVLSTALPTMVGELNGVDQMLWVMTAFILASTIMMPIYGKLGDLIGRKGLFLAAISLFIAGSVIGGLAPTMDWLIAGRVVQGLGGGGLMIMSQAIIADIVPARQRGRYAGSSERYSRSPRLPVRSSAAGSPKGSAGVGRSGSTFPSACSPWPPQLFSCACPGRVRNGCTWMRGAWRSWPLPPPA